MKPICELIFDKMVGALAAISIANGYSFDMAGVVRPVTLDRDESWLDQSIIFIPADPSRNEDLSYSGNPPMQAWDHPVDIDVIYTPDKDATDSIIQVLNQMWADVQKAIFSNPQWDGIAIDTRNGDTANYWVDEEQYLTGMTIPFIVTYRHFENNPYANEQIPA